MKHELIKTDNYLLIVDDSEIKVDDFMYFWNGQSGSIHKHKEGYATENIYGAGVKIIAHLPLNDSPILEGVPLLPLLEDDGEKMADKYANQWIDGRDAYYGYKQGYLEAKEKYKFTEDDMKYMFECGRNYQINSEITFDVAMEYLSQPKMPTHFEFNSTLIDKSNGSNFALRKYIYE